MFSDMEVAAKTILITDDERINVKILKKTLDKIGHRTICTDNGKECIEEAENSSPDLILLDISMPLLSGIDVCKLLKKNPKTQNIPIIFVTANTTDSTLKEAFEAGGTDYVRKPVNMVELLARVNSILFQQELIKEHVKDEKLKGTLEMAGTICHELNQPLQVIMGISQLLLMDIPAGTPYHTQILKIKKQIDRMGKITKKLMGITSFEERDYVERTKILDIDKAS